WGESEPLGCSAGNSTGRRAVTWCRRCTVDRCAHTGGFTHMSKGHVVCVVGLGYIGLPTATILATAGSTVIGVDVSERTVEAVNAGRVPFVEPDLESVVAGVVAQGRLRAQHEMPAADVYIVAVPTPFTGEHDVD